jgi:hypothetical protein
MGIDITGDDTTDIPADLLLGQDGLPRAVRVLSSVDF